MQITTQLVSSKKRKGN